VVVNPGPGKRKIYNFSNGKKLTDKKTGTEELKTWDGTQERVRMRTWKSGKLMRGGRDEDSNWKQEVWGVTKGGRKDEPMEQRRIAKNAVDQERLKDEAEEARDIRRNKSHV